MSDILYQEAQEAFLRGDLTRATQCLEAFIAQMPLPQRGSVHLDLSHFLQHSLQNSRNQTWEQSPAVLARIQLAQLYWGQEQATQALRQLDEVLNAYPSAELFQLQGRWQFQLQAHQAAASSWLEALRLNPAYLPAYEDLATLANLNGNSDLAYQFIQQALPYGPSPRLLEELLLACSHQAYVPMRTLFIELCVQQIRTETKPLLQQLLQNLYQQADWHHASYLGFHLNQVFPEETTILELYVLAAIQQEQYIPALQALHRVPPHFFEDGQHWFRLGVVYSQWQMPTFARFSLRKAAELIEELGPLSQERLQSLPKNPSDDALLSEITRQILVAPSFQADLKQAPAQTLKTWGITPKPTLLDALQSLLPAKPNAP